MGKQQFEEKRKQLQLEEKKQQQNIEEKMSHQQREKNEERMKQQKNEERMKQQRHNQMQNKSQVCFYPQIPSIKEVQIEIQLINNDLIVNYSRLKHLELMKEKHDKICNSSFNFTNAPESIKLQCQKLIHKSHSKYVLSKEQCGVAINSINHLCFFKNQLISFENNCDKMFSYVLNDKLISHNKLQQFTHQYIEKMNTYNKFIEWLHSTYHCYENKNISKKKEKKRECAIDVPMFINDNEKCFNTMYDMNNFVSDPLSAHLQYKKRVCWSKDEMQLFVDMYLKYGKDFRSIAKKLPLKTTKNVVEFYYLNKIDLNLKKKSYLLGKEERKFGESHNRF